MTTHKHVHCPYAVGFHDQLRIGVEKKKLYLKPQKYPPSLVDLHDSSFVLVFTPFKDKSLVRLHTLPQTPIKFSS